jgi:uncharacterized membrane protein HdeD (DUF308 family)
MGVLALVGTTKGLFLLWGDDDRRRWRAEGPVLSGWAVYHATLDPRDGTLFAATNHHSDAPAQSERLAGGSVMPPAIITAWFDDPRASDVDAREARTSVVVPGILALVGGAAAILVPPIATLTIALFVGWILVYSGVVMGIHAWTQRGAGHAGERGLMALLTLAVGAYMVLFPVGGALSLTLLLVVWFVGSAALELWTARQVRGLPSAGITLLNGVVSLVLAILIVGDLPSSAAWAIGLLVGINLMFWGTRALCAAGLLKHAAADRGR